MQVDYEIVGVVEEQGVMTITSPVRIGDVKTSETKGKHIEVKLQLPFDAEVFGALGSAFTESGNLELVIDKKRSQKSEDERKNYELEIER